MHDIRRADMDLNEFKERIPAFFEQAVTIAERISDGKRELGPSLDKLTELDGVVEYLHNLQNKGLINDTVVWNASVAFGVLLGEMIIREHGFHWVIDDQLPMVETDDGNRLSPITKLYKILTDDDNCEGSPSGFYDGFLALQQYYAMRDEEKDEITTLRKVEVPDS